MKIERVQFLLKLNQNDHGPNLTEIPMAGPSSRLVTEIPLIRMRHDIGSGISEAECSVSRAKVVGTIEIDKQAEYARLVEIYGEKAVGAVYPSGRHMPLTLDDCELPPGCVEDTPKPKVSAAAKKKQDDARRDALREALLAAGVDLPPRADLKALEVLAGDHNITLEDEAA